MPFLSPIGPYSQCPFLAAPTHCLLLFSSFQIPTITMATTHSLTHCNLASKLPSSSKMATFLFLITLLFSFTTFVLGSQKIATIQMGDSLLFNRRDLQSVYLFHHRSAFDLCDFADASLIYPGKSPLFKWTPPKQGYYYFSIKDESSKNCERGGKLIVRVVFPEAFPPSLSPDAAPPPTAGGDLPSSPSRGWRAGGGSTPPPILAPEASPLVPWKGTGATSTAPPPEPSEGMPFINSNPVIPLPTGETDTAALRPLLAPSQGASQVVGQAASLEIRAGLVAVAAIMSSSFFVFWI